MPLAWCGGYWFNTDTQIAGSCAYGLRAGSILFISVFMSLPRWSSARKIGIYKEI